MQNQRALNLPFTQELIFDCLKPIIFKEGVSKIILKYNSLDYKTVSVIILIIY